MSIFGGDNEIGNMLQDAVKLKSAQMGQKRKTYEKWPYFVQHTLFHGEKEHFKAWRQLPFDEKMAKSEELKDEGNQLFKDKNYSDAVDKYEEAGTLVHYCYSTDPGWRKNNRGIDDDVLVLVDDIGESAANKAQQHKFRVALCINIAACKLKLLKWEEAIVACNTALELEPSNVKALFRRAVARITPGKCTAYDQDLAIKDLTKANQIDPDDSVVAAKLRELRESRKNQKVKDKRQFNSFFDRGTIYKGGEGGDGTRPSAANEEMQAIKRRIEGISDDDTLEKRTADAELLRDLYMRNGKEEEARELNEKIQVAKKAVKEREAPKMDWENPTEDMIEDAKKFSLDLKDPLVIQELKRMEKEGFTGLNGDEAAAAGADSERTPLCSDALTGPPVPWWRYIGLFLAMIVAWRLVDAGILRWLLFWIWRLVLSPVYHLFGFGASEDAAFDDEERSSLFATAYRGITSFFGDSDSEEW